MSLIVRKVLVLLVAIISTTIVVTIADKSKYERDRLDSNGGPSSRQSSQNGTNKGSPRISINQVVKCSDFKVIDHMFQEAKYCLYHKWTPWPPIPPPNFDQKECCYQKDLRCQESIIYGHKCERLIGFNTYMSNKYIWAERQCKADTGIDMSDKFCLGLDTPPILDPVCQSYLTCSITDAFNEFNITIAKPIDTVTQPPDGGVQNITQPNANHPSEKGSKGGTGRLQFSLLFIAITLSLNIIFKHL